MNTINIIQPYKYLGTWVFSDERAGLDKEAFVAGADKAIDKAVGLLDIQNPEKGFALLFSHIPFPSHNFVADWDREESGGNIYRFNFTENGQNQHIEGWLCPALLLYYDQPPKQLFLEFRSIDSLEPQLSRERKIQTILNQVPKLTALEKKKIQEEDWMLRYSIAQHIQKQYETLPREAILNWIDEQVS